MEKNPNEEFYVDDLAYYFAQGNPVFWHGKSTNEVTGIEYTGPVNAGNIAYVWDGKTIRIVLLEKRKHFQNAGVNYIEIPMDDGSIYTRIKYGSTPEQNDGFWKACSEPFSIFAQGDIYTIEGTDPRPDGTPEHKSGCIYNAIELPLMMLTDKVGSIRYEIKQIT